MTSRLFAQTNALDFRFCMISAYLTNAHAIQIKIKIEPSFTQCVRATLACPKTPTVNPSPIFYLRLDSTLNTLAAPFPVGILNRVFSEQALLFWHRGFFVSMESRIDFPLCNWVKWCKSLGHLAVLANYFCFICWKPTVTRLVRSCPHFMPD